MKKLQNNIRYLLLIGIIVMVNLFGDGCFQRFDLTKEQRYSLSDLTVETVQGIEYPMVVTVFLEGEFPPNIRNFQEAVRTSLLEMKQYAGRNLEYEFVDPSNNPDLLRLFQERNFVPVPVKVQESATETKQVLMWPMVRIRYREREVYVDLLKGATVMTVRGPNVDFLKAEQDLEYKLVSALRKLQQERGGVIVLLQGHGELTPQEIPELQAEIQTSYNFFTLNLPNTPNYEISPTIDVLMVLQPTQPFSERDKYELDQYLMRGGSILWMLNQEVVDMNMYRKQATLTELRELNLDDLFFKYGCKINYDLIQDLECESTEVFQAGPNGGTFLSKKWPYFPLALAFPDHPINRNVDAVLMRYANSIDTFAQAGVKKSVFLQSSPSSRLVQGKQFIDVNQVLANPPAPSLYNRSNLITGLLMEGVFESLFVGRRPPTDSLAPNPPAARFGAKNNPIAPGSMVILSDDEFSLGKEYQGQRGYMPYDNKTLLMNAIDYLAGDEALVQIRSKSVAERRLSRDKVVNNLTSIRLLNLGLPLLILAVFGGVRAYLRRRKHAGLKEG
ncbi:MAG: gliding motility-associated ABC transporter substrate-binding protein GldG [Bacteroidota bacterium]